ncbi:MAG: nickel/cobalt transporter [Pseudomonadota bacterium]|nr:nickel/cobalt transporter [Pseudomonadota bacterium]
MAQTTGPSAPSGSSEVKIDQRKLLVRPRDAQGVVIPPFWSDPAGYVLARQQSYYGRISGALRSLRSGPSAKAVWALLLLSFGYGVFHAAGPGHGKTVISGWILATEQQMRRGILISFLSAGIQATSAIAIVSVVLLAAHAAGTAARSVAAFVETASYGLIALLGLYLVWQALQPLLRSRPVTAPRHHHHHGDEPASDGGCNHVHMPAAKDLDKHWSLARALSLSIAVGLRPCTGAILALLFANAIGLYWAGVAATFVMALGTALTVSLIAMLAVLAKRLALRLASRDDRWTGSLVFALRLAAGLIILFLGTTLFLGSLSGGGSIA